MHWNRKNSPIVWTGQFQGIERNPTVSLEPIADSKLWIWGCNFESPGSISDLNILNGSSKYQDMLEWKMLALFDLEIKKRRCKLVYYLFDGIYPESAIFIETIRMESTRKEKCFSGIQEGSPKICLMRLWCSGFTLAHTGKTLYVLREKMSFLVTKTVITMHNIIVEARRDGYESQLFHVSEDTVSRGSFVDDVGNEKKICLVH